jgi:hypothetical protein
MQPCEREHSPDAIVGGVNWLSRVIECNQYAIVGRPLRNGADPNMGGRHRPPLADAAHRQSKTLVQMGLRREWIPMECILTHSLIRVA